MTRSAKRVALAALAAGAAACVAWGCGTAPLGRWAPAGCGALDSLYASSGFDRPLSISGHATVDANQYKVRGKILIETTTPGDAVIEFTSTVLFGHAREDVLVSSLGDTLRIVDRERGAYYEGSDAERFLAESLETDLDVRRVLMLALGGRPSCEEISDLRFQLAAGGAIVLTGKHSGRSFRVAFGADRRLQEVEWPVRSESHGTDRLRAAYEWETGGSEAGALRGFVVNLERRQWRCKVRSAG